ncbi:hypothetical protein ILUMI_23785 [Ignelater luminosus]|uniref:K Homology domain-containing protein n=1 Tax=Ignelater luminosus TaxID=2038154 RepID=A0A8K0CER6_IGNLU|nr:hypothetical protein ILUMI_23785 [Ignelater luminosus]
MSLGISARLKYPKKHELAKSHSQSQILANKLRQDGVMSTVESVMQAVDQVAALLVSKHIDPNIPYKDSIINLCQHLKVYGAYLELLFEDQLNRAFIVFRNSSQDDERLDYLSRLHLLELIELRAKGWKGTDMMNQYYRKKANQCVQIEASESTSSLTESMTSATSAPPLLAPGEIIKPSGKFSKPTRIPGKNYCKDEVVIRNADSGKVMGIKGRRVHMIEELSETIISFQRVNPGAKERLVQITGANEESINHAKQLIEDTIRRNASPVREHGIAVGGPLTGSSSSVNSSASEDSALPHSARASRTLIHSLSTNDASIGEFKYTVVVGGCTIKITGDNLDLVRTSKLVLDEYFSGEPLQDIGQFYSFDSLPQPIVTHDLTGSPLSPPESLPSPGLSNGQADDSSGPAPLRRPHLAIEEIMKGKTSPDPQSEKTGSHLYSIEYLARLAMSPLCLVQPSDWERISTDYPNLVRKEVELFDVKQYLSNRSGDQCPTILSAEDLEAEEV